MRIDFGITGLCKSLPMKFSLQTVDLWPSIFVPETKRTEAIIVVMDCIAGLRPYLGTHAPAPGQFWDCDHDLSIVIDAADGVQDFKGSWRNLSEEHFLPAYLVMARAVIKVKALAGVVTPVPPPGTA